MSLSSHHPTLHLPPQHTPTLPQQPPIKNALCFEESPKRSVRKCFRLERDLKKATTFAEYRQAEEAHRKISDRENTEFDKKQVISIFVGCLIGILVNGSL